MERVGKVNIDWTPEKVEKVEILLTRYFNAVESYNSESVCQSDIALIDAPEVLGNIADVLFEDIEIDYED
ncbi:MAG: hypothetical protein ACTSPI_02350 [Candidatus Heimdallarchaeaceae archaeon]